MYYLVYIYEFTNNRYVLIFLNFYENLPAKLARFTADMFALFSYLIHLFLWASEHLFRGVRCFVSSSSGKNNQTNKTLNFFNVFISRVLKPSLKSLDLFCSWEIMFTSMLQSLISIYSKIKLSDGIICRFSYFHYPKMQCPKLDDSVPGPVSWDSWDFRRRLWK